MAVLLLLTDRGCDRLQSRIRTGDSTDRPSCKRHYLEESLECSWVQRSQRHQRPDGNVLVIHQMCFRERQRFHQGPRLVLGLPIHQEDDAFAIAARIPLANFPVEIEPYSRLKLVL